MAPAQAQAHLNAVTRSGPGSSQQSTPRKSRRPDNSFALAVAFDAGGNAFGEAVAKLRRAWKEDARQATITLKQLAKARRADVAEATLGMMAEQQVAINEFHYGAVLGACAKAGSWQLALSLVEHMAAEKIKVGVVAWTSVLSACARASAWVVALCILDWASRAKSADAALYSAGISACEKGGRWELALDILTKMLLDN
ncbi:EMB2076 [Symbiodinium natans]|uniref:EMB2076 protein n=1 Tax=Symbiodinium natans TaxID=878477 RepID=A0A812NW38_9DINO|nr:EMB2076 [Symbiodinium natans]